MPQLHELFKNVDPLTVILIIAGFIGTWTTLRKDSKWHTAWIKQHDKECDEQRKFNNNLFVTLTSATATLTAKYDGQEKRLDHIEHRLDK